MSMTEFVEQFFNSYFLISDGIASKPTEMSLNAIRRNLFLGFYESFFYFHRLAKMHLLIFSY